MKPNRTLGREIVRRIEAGDFRAVETAAAGRSVQELIEASGTAWVRRFRAEWNWTTYRVGRMAGV